jgi:hypothetical protein
MARSHRSLTRQVFRGLVVLVAAIATMAASASAATPSIVGVWHFSGGTVIVAPDISGQLVGTVASATTFGVCAHPVGQALWTDLQPTSDGGYTGLHVWYHGSGADCTPKSELGPTAFRVLPTNDGSSVLEVCFNQPGTTMPGIAPDGSPINVNYGCSYSAPDGSVPTTAPSFSQTITMPPGTQTSTPQTSTTLCGSRRDFKIHIREQRRDPFVKLTIYLGHKVFKYFRHGDEITSVIDLRGLPLGTYTIRIRARTAAGFIVKGHRTYHTCVPKIL